MDIYTDACKLISDGKYNHKQNPYALDALDALLLYSIHETLLCLRNIPFVDKLMRF
jgi:hypothetical protein